MSAGNMARANGVGKGPAVDCLELEVIPVEERATRAESTRMRFEVLKAFSFTCQYCGRSATDEELVVEHVVPIAKGGPDSPDNWTCACRKCNSGKAVSDVPSGAVRTFDRMLAIKSRRVSPELLAERLLREWSLLIFGGDSPVWVSSHRARFLESAVCELGVEVLADLMKVAIWSVPPSPNSCDPADVDDKDSWTFFCLSVAGLSRNNFMVG